MSTSTTTSTVTAASLSALPMRRSPSDVSVRSGRSVLSETVLPQSIEYHLHEPISAGFLLKFCDVHYCSENMRFITAVDRFRDHFYRDRSAWPSATWRQLDAELQVVSSAQKDFDIEEDFVKPLYARDFVAESTWPSRVVNREAIRECLVEIWEQYLAKDAKYWICMPYNVMLNTMRRMQLVHFYGPDVFTETLIDPIKTIQRDIYPRFVQSEEFRVFKRHQASLEPLPCSSKLKLPRPRHSVWSKYRERDIERGNVVFTLEDLLEDRTLYHEFSRFLEQIVALENLYCVRAIAVFKECLSSSEAKEKALAFEIAWTIYKFFIASSAAYEISLAYQIKKEIMRELASPMATTFDAVEQSAISQLKIHYARYTQTREFAHLHKIVIQNKQNALLEISTRSVATVRSGGGSSNREKGGIGGGGGGGSICAISEEKEKERESFHAKAPVRTSCFPTLF